MTGRIVAAFGGSPLSMCFLEFRGLQIWIPNPFVWLHGVLICLCLWLLEHSMMPESLNCYCAVDEEWILVGNGWGPAWVRL